MLSAKDRSYIDRKIEESIVRYPQGKHPDKPDETLMYEAAGEWMFEEVWKDELYDIAVVVFPDSEDPEEEFNALPEEDRRKHIDAYVDERLDSMSFEDVYEYVDERGYFEVDYDPHERDEWDA